VRAISHSLGIHSDGFLAEEISDDDENDCVNVDEQQQQHSVPATSNTAAADATSAKCDVRLLDPRERVVLVPCGHSRFCAQCADAVAATRESQRITLNLTQATYIELHLALAANFSHWY